MKRLSLLLLLLTSCGPMTMKDVRAEADAEVSKLTKVLREVDSKDDLITRLPKIKKGFNQIAELVLEVRSIQEKSPEFLEPSAAGDELFAELARLYEMPGGRALIETAQNDAIHRLTQ